MRDFPIDRIMTADPATVGPQDSVVEAQRRLDHHFIHHLPVVESGRLVGMVSSSDLLKLHLLAWRKSSRGVLRHHPLRDLLRNALSAPGAFRELARAAKDHRAPVGAPDGRFVAA